MYKHITSLTITFILLCIGLGTSAQEKMDQWPALKDFHMVISQTFHPSETGNLEPIKTRSGEMLEKAIALSKSSVPQAFNQPGIPAAVQELLVKVKKLDKGIKNKKLVDKAIKTQLSEVHDVYHKIIEKCMKEG